MPASRIGMRHCNRPSSTSGRRRGPVERNIFGGRRHPQRVKSGRTQCEQIWSASPPIPEIQTRVDIHAKGQNRTHALQGKSVLRQRRAARSARLFFYEHQCRHLAWRAKGCVARFPRGL
jgi:hypothetical protein